MRPIPKNRFRFVSREKKIIKKKNWKFRFPTEVKPFSIITAILFGSLESSLLVSTSIRFCTSYYYCGTRKIDSIDFYRKHEFQIIIGFDKTNSISYKFYIEGIDLVFWSMLWSKLMDTNKTTIQSNVASRK